MFVIKLDPAHSNGYYAGVPQSQPTNPITDAAIQSLKSQISEEPSQPRNLQFRTKAVEVDFRLLKLYSRTFNSHWVYIRPEGDIGVDLDIDPFHVKQLMNFLGGGELQITPHNIQGLLEAASYFNIPILLEQLISQADKFAECLEALSQEQIVDYSQILNLMIGHEYSRESQLEFISKLKVSPQLRKQLIELVPDYQDENLKIMLRIHKELASGKPLDKITLFKKIIDAIPEMNCREFKWFLSYARESNNLKEPLLKMIAAALLLKKNARIERFFENLKVAIADPEIDPIIDHLSTLYIELTKLQRKVSTAISKVSDLKSQILQEAQKLTNKMTELQSTVDKFQANNPSKNPELVSTLKTLQKAGMKIISNVDKALEIRKGKASKEQIMAIITVALCLAIFAMFLALAFWYLLSKVPHGTPYIEMHSHGPHTITPLAFRTVDIAVVPLLFSGILWGPLVIAGAYAALRQYLRTNEKLRKRHLLRGVHREMEAGG